MLKSGVLIALALVLARPATAAWQDEILAAHNAVRADAHVPPLAWSDALAAQASSWADFLARTGSFRHSPRWMLPNEGENLWMGGGARFRAEDMVGMWADEKAWYRGTPVARSAAGPVVGHYTQLVWRRTTMVGCGLATVPDRLYGDLEYLVCRYSPAGNVVGERPY